MMSTNEIRSKYLEYFKKHSHVIVPSSSLVPENDATTLFTGSGMQPMLPYLLGQTHPLGKRIGDSQKCFRAQDIEEVGDNRHTTFFEMLGNWSFGDYFKEEQIKMMWQFIIEELKLNPENVYFSCFVGNEALGIPRDEFSANVWQQLFKEKGMEVGIGVNPEKDGIVGNEHIFYYNEKKNWWSRSGVPANMPEGEPGGPDTEMFFDFDPKNEKKIHESSAWSTQPCHPNCDCGRYVEIGNNVFMQYRKIASGFEELPQQNVDFGGGLERMAAAVQNNSDIFNLDVFDGAKKLLVERSGKEYGSEEKITYAMRVILDHLRAATFLIGDGVVPGNKDQMYFVRRLVRRSVRFARDLGINESFTKDVAKTFIDTYKNEYKVLGEKEEFITNELEKEENKFRKTLDNGIRQFEKLIKVGTFSRGEPMDSNKLESHVAPSAVFELVTTFGFPIELVQEIAQEKGLVIDMGAFKQKMEEHKELSRTAGVGKFKGGLGGDGEIETKYHTATHLLHQALRTVLGETVAQKGSNITVERLRFDFAYGEKMTDEQKKQVEDLVNAKIKEALPVIREEISFDEAKARGATGLFTDKYGDKVSIYRIGEGKNKGDSNLFSIEMCGGPHISNTNELGVFKIVKEEAVSAGVRRIKAVLE